MSCELKTLRVYRGYPTLFNGHHWLSVSFNSEILITGWGAKFVLDNITKTYQNVQSGFYVDLTAQETAGLKNGLLNGTLILIDTSGNEHPFATDIPVMSSDWVDGAMELDNFDLTVNVEIQENELEIKIQSASVSQEFMELINSKQPLLTSANAGDGISITGTGSSVVISNTQTSAEWGNITGDIADQDDLQEALDSEAQLRQNADNVLAESINTEASTRASADTTLTNNLNTEISNRQSADEILQDNIDAEATTRGNADTALGGRIDTLENDLEEHIGDTENPHSVTKVQVGLGNVANVDTTNASNISLGTLSNDRLGTIPYSKLSGVASSAQGSKADTALQPDDNISELNNDAGYISGITSSMVTTALGYTPYNSTNPSGYQTSSQVNTAISAYHDNTKVDKNASITGATKCKITYDSKGLVTAGENLSASDIPDLSGTYYTTNNPNGYISGITSLMVTTALGYTPYNSTNPNGYISGITGSMVTTALGYTPYNSTNPNGYQTSAQVGTAITNSIVNNVTSSSTTNSLSANMGKALQDQITNLKGIGRFLALWNCATGLAESNPTVSPRPYNTGDYFVVGTVAGTGGTNYKPNGSEYITGQASTTVETATVAENDVYFYDGTNWTLQNNHGGLSTVSFSNITGQPTDNTNLATALNGKVSGNTAITGATKCKITYDSKGLVTGGANLTTSDIPDLSGTYYLATNPNGYINGITGTMVTSALGYTPYNSTNPSGYQTASQVSTSISAYHDSTKVNANTAITGATKTKITYDSKGLVTGGSDLSASDIPSLSLSKISDVTATASEVNVLDGITATTAELNYCDGVTGNIQTQLNGKLTGNNSITAATKTKITYDAKGLVTGGADLAASDIPNLSLSKISDVTATAAELNTLDGITASTAELNYCDGVTSNIQTQLNGKVAGNSAITASTTKKLVTYDTKGLVTGGSALASSDVTDALGYTPYNSTNPSGYQTASQVSTSISAYHDSTKVNANTAITGATKCKITYDSKGLVTGGADLTTSDIPDLSGTYYLATNPNGYINGITGTMVTSALGYTPYNSTNPSGYQTASQVSTSISAYHDSTKVNANTAITGATKTKITYDSKGLVTGGSDLSASDIPNLSLSKISDVTATASEVNVLDGITATTAELNYCDGVTGNIQTQLNGKLTGNNSITAATKTKITYDAKGLVTGGADLAASDIPNLSLSKISDVTATAAELNVLDGITATTTELNYCDGVTSNIQTQLNGKLGLSSSSNIVYGTDGSGNQQLHGIVYNAATAWSIARRNGNGQILVEEPTADTHAATKKYVDDIVGNIEALLAAI